MLKVSFITTEGKSREEEEVTQRSPLCNLFFLSGFSLCGYKKLLERRLKSFLPKNSEVNNLNIQ